MAAMAFGLSTLATTRSLPLHCIPLSKLIHHSDRGGQYASKDYLKALARIHTQQSMSSTGKCDENDVAESFFATLKTELIYRQSWPTQYGVFDGIRDYIENFFNCER